jgi:SlyX protein
MAFSKDKHNLQRKKLEEQISFLQNEVNQMSDEIFTQQKEIIKLNNELINLKNKINIIEANSKNSNADEDIPPPHY